ncbi:TraU family protein [Vibrio rotiferianus]
MLESAKQCLTAIFTFGLFSFLSITPAYAGMDSQCPDSKYFEGMMTDLCWSCSLPITLFGMTEPPEGANEDYLCACDDALGILAPGFSVGFRQPDQIMEVSTIPYCSPTLGGIQLNDDYTHIGTSSDNKAADAPVQDGSQTGDQSLKMVQYHYNYIASPVLKMMKVLAVSECDKSPGVVDLDILFMSPLTVEWYDDLMSFLINPDAVAFANPVGQALCIYDCAQIMATGEGSLKLWHCAGCDGSLYPLTGNITGAADNPIQASSLVTQRAIAKSHRLGLSPQTMGKDAMCKYLYNPTIPKSQYKVQLAFPVAETEGTCCHPLGENYLKYGLGRMAPGSGKDTTFVYNVFRWSDCCIPFTSQQ